MEKIITSSMKFSYLILATLSFASTYQTSGGAAEVPDSSSSSKLAFNNGPKVKRLPDIYWNTTNPIFRIDNTDHIIDVNEGSSGSQFEYDQVNIICPLYNKQMHPDESDTEKFIIYHVNKEEFDTCRIMTAQPRIIAKCDKPYKLLYFTISFRSFSPTPGALEFHAGKDYFFMSTSSKSDLHRRVDGMCRSHNMKLVFKVADKKKRDQLMMHNIDQAHDSKRHTSVISTTTTISTISTISTTVVPSTAADGDLLVHSPKSFDYFLYQTRGSQQHENSFEQPSGKSKEANRGGVKQEASTRASASTRPFLHYTTQYIVLLLLCAAVVFTC